MLLPLASLEIIRNLFKIVQKFTPFPPPLLNDKIISFALTVLIMEQSANWWDGLGWGSLTFCNWLDE